MDEFFSKNLELIEKVSEGLEGPAKEPLVELLKQFNNVVFHNYTSILSLKINHAVINENLRKASVALLDNDTALAAKNLNLN